MSLVRPVDGVDDQLQTPMLASGNGPDAAEVERFCERARELFRAIVRSGNGGGSE
jgi:hypothetical protein